MSWSSTDMSATSNVTDAGGNSEMSHTSSLQYLNSQLIAHGFAHNPGISLDGLSTSNMESVVKVLLSLMNQRVVRCLFSFLFSRLWLTAQTRMILSDSLGTVEGYGEDRRVEHESEDYGVR
jgi:hypothetical protein